ncbi:ABC transporter ATP-binding protein [Candidatus Thorarchaeota archaeon]|nr:MAG: ABC transporter ATP-binding protein [Candidatus Thorarchaeota archaeon]
MQSLNQIRFCGGSRKVVLARAENVWKIYNSGEPHEVSALRGVSLNIERGRATALGGPSGSGKTTLLSLIGLLSKPTKGNIFIEDQEYSILSEVYRTKIRREKIGFIFQSEYLMPQLTTIENVALPKLATDTPRSVAESKAKERLIELGMEKRLNFRVAELSGGERQRVSIARAMINDPDLLIADEPSSSIDQELTLEVLELLRSMMKQNALTVIVASHDPLVLEWADVKYMMEDGSIIT